MGHELRHRQQHHNLHEKNTRIQIQQHRSTFLPILCSRPSIKDVSIPRPVAISNDPLSPKIGCMGQVKRNNKIVGYPISHRFCLTTKGNDSAAAAASNAVKYSKLKRLFSGRNPYSPNNTCTPAAAPSGFSIRSRSHSLVDKRNCPRASNNIRYRTGRNDDSCESINLDQMDPPLPVIKKIPKQDQGGERNNLWRRRSGGMALESLQLKHSHLPAHRLEPTTV